MVRASTCAWRAACGSTLPRSSPAAITKVLAECSPLNEPNEASNRPPSERSGQARLEPVELLHSQREAAASLATDSSESSYLAAEPTRNRPLDALGELVRRRTPRMRSARPRDLGDLDHYHGLRGQTAATRP